MNARLNPGKGLAAALLCALALGACGHKKTAVAPPQPGDRAVAMVNGAPVFASDVNREAVTQGLIGPGEPLDPSSDRFRQVLDEVVDQKLLAAEAVRRGLDKTPAVQRRLAAARERVLGDIVLENAVGRVVNDDAVKGLYAEMLKNTTASQEYRLRQIVVPTEVEADQVKTLLAGGGAFEAVAAQHSRDETTRFQGGVLPPLTQDLLPPGYAAALENAKPGQVVGPFKTAAGFVVVRLEDKRQEAPITLEAARPQIIRFLTFDQVKDLILDLRRRAKVQVLIAPPLSVPGAPTEPASAPPAVAPPTAASPAAPPPLAAATPHAVTTTPHAALMPARAAAPPPHAARTPQAEPTTPHAATTTPPKAPALQPPAPKTASTPPPKKPTVRPRAPKTATPPPPKAPGPLPLAPKTATALAPKAPTVQPPAPKTATAPPPKAPAVQPSAPRPASTPPSKIPPVRSLAPKTGTAPPPKAPTIQPPAPTTATQPPPKAPVQAPAPTTTPTTSTPPTPKAPAVQPPASNTASTPPLKKPTVRPRAPKTATPPPPKAPGPQPPAPNTAT